MAVGERGRSDQRLPQDKATEAAREERAPGIEGAGGAPDSEVVRSAVAALGAAVFRAGVGEEEELARARERGMHMDVDAVDAQDRTGRPASATGAVRGATPPQATAVPAARSAQQPIRKAPAHAGLSADALERSDRDGQPGHATARQADPNAAPTPLQRLQEDDDLN
jgi:hypothetical protein